MMSPNKTKVLNKKNTSFNENYNHHRSSLKVNLSYMSNSVDTDYNVSANASLGSNRIDNIRKSTENNTSSTRKDFSKSVNKDDKVPHYKNVRVSNGTPRNTNLTKNVKVTDVKEVRGKKISDKLKNAILNKTRELFDDDNEILIQTTKVLSQAPPITKSTYERQIEISLNCTNNEIQYLLKGLPDSSSKLIAANSVELEEYSSCSDNLSNTPKNTLKIRNRDVSGAIKHRSLCLKKRLFVNENKSDTLKQKSVHQIQNINDYSLIRPIILEDVTLIDSSICSNHGRLKLLKQQSQTRNEYDKNICRHSVSDISDITFSPSSPIICSSFIEKLETPKENSNDENLKEIRRIQRMTNEHSSVIPMLVKENNRLTRLLDKDHSKHSFNTIKKSHELSKCTGYLEKSSMDLTVAQGNILETNENLLDKKEKCKLYSLENSRNTVQTSMNVNTSLDPVLIENLHNSKTNESVNEKSCTACFSLQVNTSLDSVRRSEPLKTIVKNNVLEKNFNILEQMPLMQRLRNMLEENAKNIPKEPIVMLHRQKVPTTSLLERSTRSNAENENEMQSTIRKSEVFVARTDKVLTPIVDNRPANDTVSTVTDPIQKKTENIFRARHRYPSICAKMINSGVTLNTAIVDSPSSQESGSDANLTVIPESFHESEMKTVERKKRDKGLTEVKVKSTKTIKKRRLFPTNQDCETFVSLSPGEIRFAPSPLETVNSKSYKKDKNKKQFITMEDKSIVSRETTVEIKDYLSESQVDNVVQECNGTQWKKMKNNIALFKSLPKKDKVIKKRRKVLSKKIIVKKVAELDALENLQESISSYPKQSSSSVGMDSLSEFHRNKIIENKHFQKSNKKILVITGFSNEDKDLIKSIVKSLGKAEIEKNVTKRTTHVITTGVRTINLLKAIIRGCWLVNMEWVLKSLESHIWLEPDSFEVAHFSEAVRNNRKERQHFGNAYVPELFMSCGPTYVENSTNVPASVLKELIKTAGGQITEDHSKAKFVIGSEGLRESWILDSITTGKIQPVIDYSRTN